MQLPLPERPEPLPNGPILDRFLFESPLLLTTVLAISGLVILFALNRRGEARKGLTAFAVCFALAVGAYLAGSLVLTERERLKEATRDLVASVAEVDVASLDELLAENVSFRYRNARGGLDKSATIAEVERYLGGAYKVQEHEVLELQATIDSSNVARTQVNVRVTVDVLGTHPSWWRLDWRLEPGGRWRVTGIEPLHPWLRAD